MITISVTSSNAALGESCTDRGRGKGMYTAREANPFDARIIVLLGKTAYKHFMSTEEAIGL